MTLRQAVARIAPYAFVLLCLVFAVASFRGRGGEIATALTQVSVGGAAVAYATTLVGLLAAAAVWRNVTDDFGLHIPPAESTSIYFISQLGKYIPGSVWSIGVQAQLAATFKAERRVTAGAGLVTLGYLVASGALVGTTLAAVGAVALPWPPAVSAAAAVAAAVGLSPAVINRIGTIAAGQPLAIGWPNALHNLAMCLLMWAVWPIGVVAPYAEYAHVVTVAGVFGLCYALGVVIILAPAGLGPREALFVTLLAPVVSLPAAVALAIVSRLVHVVADVTIALASWAWARRVRATGGESLPGS